jgi:hypothetical protein
MKYDFLVDYKKGKFNESVWECGITYKELQQRMNRMTLKGYTAEKRAVAKSVNQIKQNG